MNYTRYTADSVDGWNKLSLHNCTHLTYDFVTSGNGRVLDTATLYKRTDVYVQLRKSKNRATAGRREIFVQVEVWPAAAQGMKIAAGRGR